MNTEFTVDTSELLILTVDLANAYEIFGAGSAIAVNRVANATRKNTVVEITSQINLEKGYVAGKVILASTATDRKPQAILEIADEAVSLANYGAKQQTKSNVWTAAKYAAKFGSLATPVRLPSGKSAQWIPRTGDSLRGIQQGQKAAGISARVSNSRGNQPFKHVFIMPVLSGKQHAGRWGAFSHERSGKNVNAMYGPSVYQAAKGVWRDMDNEIGDALDYEVSKEISNRIEKALKTK